MKLLEAPTTDWARENGPHAEYVAKLAALGPVSLIASETVSYYSRKQDISLIRNPDDRDMFVHDDIFFDAFWMLAPGHRKLIPAKRVQLTSNDGARISLEVDEITGWPHASREGPEIQIMRSLGPVRCEMPNGSVHFYNVGLDEKLAAYNVWDGLPYLHPQAGAMMYAMYQRGLPKLDGHNASVLQRAANGMESSRDVRALMEARGFGDPRIRRMLAPLGNVAAMPLRAELAVAA